MSEACVKVAVKVLNKWHLCKTTLHIENCEVIS